MVCDFRVAVYYLKKARNGLAVTRFFFSGLVWGFRPNQGVLFIDLFLFCAVRLSNFTDGFSDCLEDLVDV